MNEHDSFQKARATLHHDRLKNEFLLSMGFYPTDESSSERWKIMQAAIDGESSTWRRLDRGCQSWMTLGPDISAFLNTLSERYGFVLSEQYHREHQVAEAAMTVLNEFVEKIEKRALQPHDIERFWQAADAIRNLLRDLEKSRRFSEFVIDIDVHRRKEEDRV